jgi:tRNA pseudouridine38-40 synthase
MPRYRILIEYNGTNYYGWQRQLEHASIQGAIEASIKGLVGAPTHLQGCGRTDAGVHALGQVAHFDCEKIYPEFVVREALNAKLVDAQDAISILDVQQVGQDFHARHSAIKRHYLYKIVNRRSPLSLDMNQAWQVRKTLDIAAMNEAAQHLIGLHDFSTFRASECQAKSPIRSVETLNITACGDKIEITTSARSFLHHQVRSFVGSLVQVGLGKWAPDDLKAALESKDRTRCGPQAPACGLYFVKAEFKNSE